MRARANIYIFFKSESESTVISLSISLSQNPTNYFLLATELWLFRHALNLIFYKKYYFSFSTKK